MFEFLIFGRFLWVFCRSFVPGLAVVLCIAFAFHWFLWWFSWFMTFLCFKIPFGSFDSRLQLYGRPYWKDSDASEHCPCRLQDELVLLRGLQVWSRQRAQRREKGRKEKCEELGRLWGGCSGFARSRSTTNNPFEDKWCSISCETTTSCDIQVLQNLIWGAPKESWWELSRNDWNVHI